MSWMFLYLFFDSFLRLYKLKSKSMYFPAQFEHTCFTKKNFLLHVQRKEPFQQKGNFYNFNFKILIVNNLESQTFHFEKA